MGQWQLRRVLIEHVDFYHRVRSHQGIEQHTPLPNPDGTIDRPICRRDVWGVLHNYCRQAAWRFGGIADRVFPYTRELNNILTLPLNMTILITLLLTMLLGSLGNIPSASMSLAVQRVLTQLYRGIEEAIALVTDMIPEKEWRNQEITRRYLAGERAVDLAREFGISVRRVNRLIRRYFSHG